MTSEVSSDLLDMTLKLFASITVQRSYCSRHKETFYLISLRLDISVRATKVNK